MASDQGFHDYAMERLDLLGDVSSRAMFGGWGIFEQGAMFALISGAALYFKVDDASRAAYIDAGSEPFGRMPYYEVPGDVLEDTGRLAEWAREALAVAHAAPKKGPKKGKRSAAGSSGGKGPPSA